MAKLMEAAEESATNSMRKSSLHARRNEPNAGKLPNNCRLYGRVPGRQVAVVLEPSSDPKDMLKGMEEYLFKSNPLQFGT